MTAYRRNRHIVGGWDQPVTLFEGALGPIHNMGDGFVYQDILASLEKKLEDGHLAIRVTGLPGQGKQQIYSQLKSEGGSKLFRNPIPLVCDALFRYEDWERLIKELIKAGAEHKRKIFVINDQAGRLGGRTRFQHLENIEEKLGDIANSNCRVIYLFDYVSSPPNLPNGFEAYPLPPLGAEALHRLVERYSSRLPIKHSHISALTGGYLGFVLSLLQDVKRIIEESSGAKPIEVGTSWSLIVEALRGSKDLLELTERFFAVIADEPGGRSVGDFLRLELEDRIRESGATEDLLKPLRFNLEGAAGKLSERGARFEKEDFALAVATLTDARLLELEDDGQYRLLELVPFLVHSLHAANTLRGGRPAGSAQRSHSDETIFVSYSREDQDRVRPIVNTLRADGFKLWWDEDQVIGGEWNAELNSQLRRATCILLVWSREVTKRSRWVVAEGLRAPDKVVSVLLDEDLDIPSPFNGIQHADLIGWDGTESADEWVRLVKGIRAKFVEQSVA